ncbi:hypothetical protein WAI453_004243 [Rhynchosporium graminicola]|uniref:2EXR domain-containing protein n=1 Tax=Rhynchosporium graminicola TaxID=2792576 RepID=A0A1E1K189_9HELO|nr:uncharacterized protein RCO7_08603 [Rhynchosporium commune]
MAISNPWVVWKRWPGVAFVLKTTPPLIMTTSNMTISKPEIASFFDEQRISTGIPKILNSSIEVAWAGQISSVSPSNAIIKLQQQLTKTDCETVQSRDKIKILSSRTITQGNLDQLGSKLSITSAGGASDDAQANMTTIAQVMQIDFTFDESSAVRPRRCTTRRKFMPHLYGLNPTQKLTHQTMSRIDKLRFCKDITPIAFPPISYDTTAYVQYPSTGISLSVNTATSMVKINAPSSTTKPVSTIPTSKKPATIFLPTSNQIAKYSASGKDVITTSSASVEVVIRKLATTKPAAGLNTTTIDSALTFTTAKKSAGGKHSVKPTTGQCTGSTKVLQNVLQETSRRNHIHTGMPIKADHNEPKPIRVSRRRPRLVSKIVYSTGRLADVETKVFAESFCSLNKPFAFPMEFMNSKAKKSLACFLSLPAELRLMIWNLARPEARVIKLSLSKHSKRDEWPPRLYSGATIPNLLHICEESRQVARKWYSASFSLTEKPRTFAERLYAKNPIYFDRDNDYLYSSCVSCRGGGDCAEKFGSCGLTLLRPLQISFIKNVMCEYSGAQSVLYRPFIEFPQAENVKCVDWEKGLLFRHEARVADFKEDKSSYEWQNGKSLQECFDNSSFRNMAGLASYFQHAKTFSRVGLQPLNTLQDILQDAEIRFYRKQKIEGDFPSRLG